MQRKDLLKGQLYRAGQNIVRVLDTSVSPVPAEQYDFIGQTFVPVKDGVQPRDIDNLARDFDPVQAYDSFNNAAQQRQVFAQLDAFNAGYTKTEDERAVVSTRRVQVDYRVQPTSSVKITIPAVTYNRAVEALTGATPVGSITMDGDLFIRFTTQVGIKVQPVADIAEVPFPGLLPEQVTTDAVQQVIADRKAKADRRSFVNSVANEIAKTLQVEAEKHEANAEKVAAGRYISFRDLPDYKQRAVDLLAERGITGSETPTQFT